MLLQFTKRFNSVNAKEVAKFNQLAKEWWEPYGSSAMLHRMNPCRVQFIQSITSLRGIRVLDVGCGGGILSESLARLGASVTGIDAAENNIQVAKRHKELDPAITDKINYLNITAESLVEQKKEFDVVCALEIIEHVDQPRQFVKTLGQLVKPEGLVFISTINRNLASYATGITLAEDILRWVPKNTHEYEKFLKPTELDQFCAEAELSHVQRKGMLFNPWKRNWFLSEQTTLVNYIQANRRISNFK